MSGLKSLAICYLATASVFIMAATLSAHRDQIRDMSLAVRKIVDHFAFAPSEQFGAPVRLDLSPPGPNDARDLAHATVPPMPRKTMEPRPFRETSIPVLIAPDLPEIKAAPQGKAAPRMADTDLTPAQRSAVTARLAENLTPEMRRNFSLFLYVSKAASGPLAQRLYVVGKNKDGGLELIHDWAASTGREQSEVTPHGRRAFTDTPRGYYELDPDRMYPRYQSHAWDQSMPYAMFFNWEHQGEQTGLAIHAASGADIEKLGRRASAGCVHLSPEHARELYNLIRADYRGATPRFAYDRDGEMSNQGELLHGRDGRLKMADGYQVLIFIEDFGGRNLMAALD